MYMEEDLCHRDDSTTTSGGLPRILRTARNMSLDVLTLLGFAAVRAILHARFDVSAQITQGEESLLAFIFPALTPTLKGSVAQVVSGV